MSDITKELYQKGLIIINGYNFYPDEISSFGNTNTKTYAIEPSRAEDFSIADIDEIPTAEIPRLRINFDIMSLTVWRRLKLAFKPNQFKCTYYDWEYDRVVTHFMYFATQDDIDIFNNFGVNQEYYIKTKKTIDIVSTMNPLNKVVVTYRANGGLGTIAGQSVAPNELFTLSTGSTLSRNGYSLTKWNTKSDGRGMDYSLGMNLIISNDLTLYAVWIPISKRTLSFDYQGALQQERDTNNNNWIVNKEVTYNQAVGTLPSPVFNLTKNDILVKVADLIGWYNLPYDWKTNGRNHSEWLKEQESNSMQGAIKRYTSGTIYIVDGNSTIYAHWLPIELTLTFDSNGGTQYAPLKTYYQQNIDRQKYLPTKQGYTFDGWYVDPNFNQPFNFIMYGESITIYAKWNEV